MFIRPIAMLGMCTLVVNSHAVKIGVCMLISALRRTLISKRRKRDFNKMSKLNECDHNQLHTVACCSTCSSFYLPVVNKAV